MSLRELPRGEWRGFCDRVSKSLVGKRAELEIVSLEIGDRRETRWLPLLGIVYDTRSDVLEIALKGVDHLISRPIGVYAEETSRGLVAVQIVAADETRQTVRLREPLALSEVSHESEV
jgi:hypothetical protein